MKREVRKYPNDGGLKEQVRDLSECFNGSMLLVKRFGKEGWGGGRG